MDKKTSRLRRAKRTRAKIRELSVPRLTVHRTPRHIYAQVIDADGSRVLASASSVSKDLRGSLKNGGNVDAAVSVGKSIAEKASAAAAEGLASTKDMVAKFDVKSSEFYEDGSDFYRVYFYIPDGKIVAAYDRDGKILYTIEKFKNVALPNDVASAVAERFPGWKIAKDVYKVNYDNKLGALKQYKIVLENGKKTIRIKVDEEGTIL